MTEPLKARPIDIIYGPLLHIAACFVKFRGTSVSTCIDLIVRVYMQRVVDSKFIYCDAIHLFLMCMIRFTRRV